MDQTPETTMSLKQEYIVALYNLTSSLSISSPGTGIHLSSESSSYSKPKPILSATSSITSSAKLISIEKQNSKVSEYTEFISSM
ncbi:hypothetical protein AYI70_g3137 [Smittium culicis]|uniref:Uncharacterized protein n=1 Tax=Smittium culicis TaxID=133412 RepID=A0A1R1Y4W2_9FUNG|nr:hypothetical protein AYI70_g3137 [Smittium culicis]